MNHQIKEKPAHLVVYTGTVHYANINYEDPTNTDPHYSKAPPRKIDDENCHLILYLDHMRL
jgi:hypothetical protein